MSDHDGGARPADRVEEPAAGGSVVTGRSFDRLIGFTDGVVAIAITVLVLPLVGLTDLEPGQSVWNLIGEHADQVFAFALTFCVVAVLWSVHNRVLGGARGYDGAIFWLNVGWLGLIVFLPWPAALMGVATIDDRGFGGISMLYWSTMAAISIFSTLMARHLRRHPELLHPGTAGADSWQDRARGPVFAAYCLMIGLVSLAAPSLASWMPLGLIPIGAVLGPSRRRRRA